MNVSIIIPRIKGKREKIFKEALASIKEQIEKPIEVIIMDKDENQRRKLNQGITKSKGDAFIAFSDDDILDPAYIKKTASVMRETGADIVGTALETFGNEKKIHMFNIIPFGTCLIRKSIWKKVGGYDEKILGGGDHDFLIMALHNGAKVERIAEPLLKYRIHDDNWSNRINWKKINKERESKYKKLGVDYKSYGITFD